jgi:hypothetical protein
MDAFILEMKLIGYMNDEEIRGGAGEFCSKKRRRFQPDQKCFYQPKLYVDHG